MAAGLPALANHQLPQVTRERLETGAGMVTWHEVSPDEQWVVYSKEAVMPGEEGEGVRAGLSLHSMRTDGSGAANVLMSFIEGTIFYWEISGDSQWVVFRVHHADGTRGLFVAPMDGSAEARALELPWFSGSNSWLFDVSRSGGYVVHTASDDSNRHQMSVTDLATGETLPVAGDVPLGWHVLDRYLVFMTGTRLGAYDLEAYTVRQISHGAHAVQAWVVLKGEEAVVYSIASAMYRVALDGSGGVVRVGDVGVDQFLGASDTRVIYPHAGAFHSLEAYTRDTQQLSPQVPPVPAEVWDCWQGDYLQCTVDSYKELRYRGMSADGEVVSYSIDRYALEYGGSEGYPYYRESDSETIAVGLDGSHPVPYERDNYMFYSGFETGPRGDVREYGLNIVRGNYVRAVPGFRPVGMRGFSRFAFTFAINGDETRVREHGRVTPLFGGTEVQFPAAVNGWAGRRMLTRENGSLYVYAQAVDVPYVMRHSVDYYLDAPVDEVVLEVEADGMSALAYAWERAPLAGGVAVFSGVEEGRDFAGADASRLMVREPHLHPGMYRCRVSGADGHAYSRASVVLVDPGLHSADTNGDRRIDLHEVLRVVQLFAAGAYSCSEESEDGYAPGAGETGCEAHDSDFDPQDWAIGLLELLRLVQMYNSEGYVPCGGTEDGYCVE